MPTCCQQQCRHHTLNQAAADLHFNKVVRTAVEDRVIATNPVERIPLPKLTREEMRFLSVDELWRLGHAIDRRYRALVLLGGYGGLRIGETLALRWGRVDLDRGRIDTVEGLIDLAGTITFGPAKTKAALRSLTVPRFVATEFAAFTGGLVVVVREAQTRRGRRAPRRSCVPR